MTIDLTGVAVALTGSILSIVGTVFAAWLASHMKDKQAALVISNAVKNSLGAVQQAAQTGIAAHPLQVSIPGLSAAAGAGVQYVLNQAGPELARYGITPATVAEKVEAQIGLAAVATNLAVAASPSPVVPAPTGPVPTVAAQGAVL